jgi:LacI family transcriptional regulator
MAAARELGYVAHGPARALRRAKTDVIGLVVSDIRNPFFSDLAHAAEIEANRLGYTILLANADEDAARESMYLRTFASQRIDGLLIVPQTQDAAAYGALVQAGFPLVFADRSVPGLSVPTISSDNRGGVRQATAWLQSRGRRTVAYVGGPGRVSTAAERLEAFLEERAERGFADAASLVAEGDFRMESGEDAARRILALGPRPDAFLVADGLMTLGVVRELRRAGIAPADIDVVSFDDAPWFDVVDTPVSAVLNDAAEIGRRGLQALSALLAGEPAPSSTVPTRFIERTARPA